MAGGGGQTLPHKHTNIANDGSPLDMNNVTIGSLAAGSITYSDGAALQELTIGAGATVLTSTAGVPAWAAAGGGATLTRNYSTYGTAQSTSSATLVDLTNGSVTLTGAGSGNAVCQYNALLQTDESYAYAWEFSVDGVQPEISGKATNTTFPVSMEAITETLGSQDVTIQYRVKNPAGTAINGIDNTNSNLYVLEIS